MNLFYLALLSVIPLSLARQRERPNVMHVMRNRCTKRCEKIHTKCVTDKKDAPQNILDACDNDKVTCLPRCGGESCENRCSAFNPTYPDTGEKQCDSYEGAEKKACKDREIECIYKCVGSRIGSGKPKGRKG